MSDYQEGPERVPELVKVRAEVQVVVPGVQVLETVLEEEPGSEVQEPEAEPEQELGTEEPGLVQVWVAEQEYLH
jgi:hypothetical protein